MRIDTTTRTVTLSVGEFSTFRPYAMPGFGGVAAAWRAQLGTQWHQRIQADSAAAGENMADETPIQGNIAWRGWTISLNGRIDQMRRDPETTRLREIKTVSEPLPIPRDAILDRYLAYPIQLLAYRELLLRNEELRRKNEERETAPRSHFDLELLFVEIGSGLTQSLTLDPSYDTLIVDQLDILVDYLEAKEERLHKLRSLHVRSAYPRPRPGQETIQDDLAAAFDAKPIVLLEAPTGYGKTGVAWEHAARRLASGQADRIIYLTSKSTGQAEAVIRLRALLAAPPQLEISNLKSQIQSPSPTATFWHIRNKQEHCIHSEFRCSAQTCPYLTDLHAKWKRAGLQRLYLLSHDEIELETLHAEGRSTGICPYEMMRAGLGYRDVWIGDYNYLFSPNSMRLLADQADYDPARTFLIIDEAHNLPSRVAGAFTHDLDTYRLYSAVDDLKQAGAASRLQTNLKTLALLIADLPQPGRGQRAEAASPRLEAEFVDTVSVFAEQLASEPLPYEDLQPETLELIFTITAANAASQRGELSFTLWSPAAGAARFECIDASRVIAAQLRQFNGALALSATLSPVDSYLEEIGLDLREVHHLRPQAPWRENAYQVAIDLRVDTRLKTREAHLAKTADTIAQLAANASPAIVFFPSYAYAEKALATLQLRHPEIRALLQPRAGGSLADRIAFLEKSLAFNDALFLILGSSYAEGVDSLGGKAGSAMVVSPALPEMNLIQECKRARFEATGRNGFERAYLQPGIQKVNQALGRLVRAPGHKAKVLLHCQRFGEPKTRALLDPLYQSREYLHGDQDLERWLSP